MYPCYGEGWEVMTPQDVLYPNVETEGRNNNQLGNKISQEFNELKIPFPPYNLRHAYAQRMYKQGFSDTIHCSLYGPLRRCCNDQSIELGGTRIPMTMNIVGSWRRRNKS